MLGLFFWTFTLHCKVATAGEVLPQIREHKDGSAEPDALVKFNVKESS